MRIVSLFLLAMCLTAASPAPQETYVETAGPKGPLKGTMLSPVGGHVPAILMIPGSGPTDRDGNSPLGLKAATLKLMAEGLVAQGISTVRIDKRGMFASAAAVPDPNAVTIDGYAEDVHAWVDTIRDQTGAQCIWVLGHSEGGLVALRAGQDRKGICGLILISTPGRKLGMILHDQLNAKLAGTPLMDKADAVIAELEAGKHVDVRQLPPALAQLFRPNIQDFWISEMALDPARLLAAVDTPVLILQGQRDLQVSAEDANILKRAKSAANLVLLPDVNHVLKVVPSDDRAANVATYADPSLPLAPEVVPSIARFVALGK